MNNRFGLLFAAVLIFPVLFLTGCKEPSGTAKKKKPIEISVSITGPSLVEKGKQAVFNAEVTEGEVEWELFSSSVSTLTVDPQNNLKAVLNVSADETEEELYIVVTSLKDQSKSNHLVVTLTDAIPPPVLNLSGSAEAVKGGAGITYTAEITTFDGSDGGGVNWELNSVISALTEDPANNLKAVLHVSANETASSLTVKAASKLDPQLFKTITVSLLDDTPLAVYSVELDVNQTTVTKGETFEFTYYIDAEEGASYDIDWDVTGNTSSGTTVVNEMGSQHKPVGLLTVDLNENATEIKVKIIVKPRAADPLTDTATVTIKALPVVTGIELTHDDRLEVTRGNSKTFGVKVDAETGADTSVLWDVQGKNNQQTSINNGILFVSEAETAKTLTVIVKSKTNAAIQDSVTVNILNPFSIVITAGNSVFSGPGGYLAFNAKINDHTLGENEADSDEITWEVTGSAQTGASSFVQGNPGRLNIGAAETAGVLTVKAKSALTDYTDIVSNEIEIRVLQDLHYAVNSGDAWTISDSMTKQTGNGTFVHEVTVSGETIFRLNLNGKTAENGQWFGPETGETNKNVDLDDNYMEYFEGNQPEAWALPGAGKYRLTVTPHELKMHVYKQGVEPLNAPAAPHLNSAGIVTWTGLNDETYVTGYTLELFKNDIPLRDSEVTVNKGQAYNYNYLTMMREDGLGAYTVKVKALSDNIHSAASPYSASSEAQTVKRRDHASNLSWSGNNASWTASSDPGVGYKVTLYRDGELVRETETVTGLSYDFTNDIGSVNGSYTFRVLSLGDNALIMDSELSEPSAANFKLLKVWLVDSRDNYTAAVPMTLESGKFVWNKNLDVRFEGAVDFRFRLSENHPDFFVPSTGLVIGHETASYDMIRITADTPNSWRAPMGSYIFTIEMVGGEWKLRTERPVIVTNVSLTDVPAFVTSRSVNTEYPIGITLEGINTDAAIIRWEVEGTNASYFGEGIRGNTLTVTPNEKSNALTIKLWWVKTGGDELLKTLAPITVNKTGSVKINYTVQVPDHGGANLIGVPNGSLTISKSAKGSVTLTVTPKDGQTGFEWIVSGGERITGTSITLNAADYGIGSYYVRLIATINGKPWSSNQIVFTVIQ